MEVLVADDDRVARQVLKRFLEQSHYKVRLVENGQTALETLKEPNAPSVAIVDWMMPDLNGPDLCRELRAQALPIQPHILILSSKTDKAEVATALDAGADDFLSKPFNMLEMQARLRLAKKRVQYQQRQLDRVGELAEALRARTTSGTKDASTLAGMLETAPDQSWWSELDASIRDAFKKAGLTSLEEQPSATANGETGPNGSANLVTWTGILLPAVGVWIDFLAKWTPDSLGALAAKQRENATLTEKEANALAGETSTTIAAAIQAALPAHAPSCPLSAVTRSVSNSPLIVPAELTRRSYLFSGAPVTLTLAYHRCPALPLKARQLRPLDVLAEGYPAGSSQDLALFRQHTVLTPHFIDKIETIALTTVDDPTVPIFRPSPLARGLLVAD